MADPRIVLSVIRMKVAKIRSKAREIGVLMDVSGCSGLHSLSAVDLAVTRDELRRTADELDAMIGTEELRDAA